MSAAPAAYLFRSPWSWASRVDQHYAHWVVLTDAEGRGVITSQEREQRMRDVETMIYHVKPR